MDPAEIPTYPHTLGALVAASKSILQTSNDFGQDSSSEDTIAEDMSEGSQNIVDGVADANTSTSNRQFTALSSLKAPPEMPHVIAHSIMFNDLSQHNNGCSPVLQCSPILQDDGTAKKRDHKKRSKNWSVHETLKLIRARGELDERFRSSGRKAALWEEIAQTLQKADVSRDGQQCKDKWEKLTAGYKEVREGAREKDDLPFYKEIHQILFFKQDKKENAMHEDGLDASNGEKKELANGHVTPSYPTLRPYAIKHENNVPNEESIFTKKRKRDTETLTDVSIVQELLETILTAQQQLIKDLLDAVERKESIREQIRQEREEIWRAEERAQRYAFNNTMIILIQRLLGEKTHGMMTTVSGPTAMAPVVSPVNAFGSSKKRSKNWKRTEVFQLIRIRKEMEGRFAKSSRRAGLWEEVGSRLASLNIKRDGKQCREKWDKLMAGYKDVIDGRREKDESPYYKELASYMEMIKDLKNSVPAGALKEELVPT